MKDSASASLSSYSLFRRWLAWLARARFTQLLIGLALLLFLSPIVGIFSNQIGKAIATTLVVVLLANVLIAAALAVSDERRHAGFTIVFAGACVCLTLLAQFTGSSTLRVIQELSTICFLIHVVQLVVRALFQQDRADFDAIAASLCGYLLIGVLFAVVFSLVMELDGTAISMAKLEQSSEAAIHFGDQHTATALYFSFVTLTTLGYGDITPVSMLARMLTTLEALIGQLYLVVLVARLVGLHMSIEMENRRS